MNQNYSKIAKYGAFRTPFTALLTALISLVVTNCALATPDLSDSLTLDQVVQMALQSNGNLAAMRRMEEAAYTRAEASGAWDDPMLMLGVSNLPTSFDFGADPMTMKMIGLSQTIPYAGEKGLTAKAQKADAGAESARRKMEENELVVMAKMAFADLYFQQQNLIILQSQKEILEQVAEASLNRLNANQAMLSEVQMNQGNIFRQDAEILTLKQSIAEAQYQLNILRGASAETSLPPLKRPLLPDIPDSATSWIKFAEENYPALEKLDNRSRSLSLSAAAARKMRWPMLSLSAEYGFREKGDLSMGPRDNMLNFQISLALPVFSFRSQGKMARSMEAMAHSTALTTAQLRLELHSTLRSLHQKARRLRETLELYQNKILPNDDNILAAALNGYGAGRETLPDLLAYTAAIYNDRLTRNRIQMELYRTMYEVEKYTRSPENNRSQNIENISPGK